MAIIPGLSASFSQFTINGTNAALYRCIGKYGTKDILNSGETFNETPNIINYYFNIKGLRGYTIKSITINSLLLNQDGSLKKSQNLKLSIIDYGEPFLGNLIGSDINKLIIPTTFKTNLYQELDTYTLNLLVENTLEISFFYGLQSILLEIDFCQIKLIFSGPEGSRNPLSIVVSTLVLDKGSTEVSFSKDPLNNYNPETDSVVGRVYFKHDGIFIDDYLYGVNALATETISGTVKLSKNSFESIYELDNEGNLIQIGVVPPNEDGVAATPQLVYNTLASAINYTNEITAPIELQIIEVKAILDGIEAPLIINIEDDNGTKESLGEELTFSNDFELKDKKLYIKWLEIS